MGNRQRLNVASWELKSLEDQVHPGHTALLVVDMQNDFVSPKGKMASFGFDVSMVEETMPTLKGFLEEARKLGIFIVHARVINDATQNAPSWYAFWGEPTVTIEGTGLSTTTLADGTYAFNAVPIGIYDVSCSAAGYNTGDAPGVFIYRDQTTTVDFEMLYPEIEVTPTRY